MICGHCKGDHMYAYQVRECSQGRGAAQRNRLAAQTRVVPAPTKAQLDYIEALAKKKGMSGHLTVPETRSQASTQIAYLKKQRDVANPERPGPVVAFPIVNLLKHGRYAVKVEDGSNEIFVHVTRPKTGPKKGHVVVSTKHGEYLTKRVQYTAEGKLIFQNNRSIAGQSLAEVLVLILADAEGAAMAYAQKLGVCCRCGKDLTDHRSRHYGIGPECEKVWPSYMARVDEVKGDYVPA